MSERGRGRSGAGGRGRGGGRRGESPRGPQPPASVVGGGRGRGGGRGGEFPRSPPPARSGGGGRDGEFPSDPPPASSGGGGRGGEFPRGPPPASRGGGGLGGEFPSGPRPTSSGGVGRRVEPPSSSPSPSSATASTAICLSSALDRKLVLEESSAVAEVAAGAPPPSSSKALRHPLRPGFGTLGRKIVVRANHFLVQIRDIDICHYDVSITPEVRQRSLNREILKELVKSYGESRLARKLPAYDGRKNMYTAGELPFTSEEFLVKTTGSTDFRKDKEYKVVIKLVGHPDLHYLRQFLLRQQVDAPQEAIHSLDVVLRESPTMMYTMVGKSFFSPLFGNRSDIGDGLECWRGYYQSLRPTQMGLSLNIDISATSFYKPVNVVEFIVENLQLRDARMPLSDRDRTKVKKLLRGIQVEPTHTENYRRYKITGLSTLLLSRLMFPVEGGGEMSVVQYFKDRYKCQLRHTNWPCLQAGSDSNPKYLPMEVCKIVDGQRFSKKLNDRQVTAILRATCKRPHERERSIQEMVRRNNYPEDTFVEQFGLNIFSQLVSVDARVLPPPKLKYHETGKERECVPAVGQWNMINKKMVNGGNLQNWSCISFSRLNQGVVESFCYELSNMCNRIGMIFNSYPLVPIRCVSPDRLEVTLKQVHIQSTKASENGLQLLLIVMPEIRGSYGKIKLICETDLGIVTQCCLPKHVSQCKPQYLENISQKINVKVGGRNTVLDDALNKRIPLVTDIPTIIFGADVTHPAPGEESSASIAAVVASMDWPHVTKYRALVSAQSRREEMIKDLYTVTRDPEKGLISGGMIRELLLGFYRSNRTKPNRIIFYRDGVSEGQFNQVLLYEVDAIRKACVSLEEEYLPPITLVVVQKRHHTRLFPMPGSRDVDRSGNILPGTVVDTKICHPIEFDFYLNSHAGIQGTSRPTHYHVLWDENRFTADQLQTLTNNLCYTYARCTRSVSVVPPAYYAHLAAFRARYYVEGDSDSGSTSAGVTRGRADVTVRPLPKIKDNVKDVMFFC